MSDPDVDLRVPAQRRELSARVLAAISIGGVVGAEARYGLGLLVSSVWTTLAINVTGCLLIGVLMTRLPRLHPLARPLLGVGVLGGYTTFSGYAVDVQRQLATGQALVGIAILVATPVLALPAARLGAWIAR